MTLLDRLQARVDERAKREGHSQTRSAIGLPAAPPPEQPSPNVEALISRLKIQAGVPQSYQIPEDGGPRQVEGSHEMDRILALPRRPAAWPDAPDLSPLYVHTPGPCDGGCRICKKTPVTLRRVQSAALYEARQENGLLGPIGVGWGKTLIALLLPDAMEARRTVILTRAALRDQMVEDIPVYSRHYRVPGVWTHWGEPTDTPPQSGVFIVAYEMLSSTKWADVLEYLNPDLLVCDEAQSLRHRTSARTKRWLRFTDAHAECRVVNLSGSMATRSLKDFEHLSRKCLRARSPLPRKYPDLCQWSAALDVPKGDALPLHPGALVEAFGSPEDRAKAEAGEMSLTEVARRGFSRRLVESPGVVATDDEGATMGLVLRPHYPPTMPEDVKAAMNIVRRDWTTPDGEEELADGASLARVLKQLACGFYQVWDWGTAGRDEEWLTARRNWHKIVREICQLNRKGMDSLKFVSMAAQHGKLDSAATAAWRAWEDVAGRWKPHPPTRAIWISDWFIQDVIRWGEERHAQGGNGIVWYEHIPVAERLKTLSGWPVFMGGDNVGIRAATPDVHPIIVASRNAHGEGKNLQAYSANLITCPMANGTAWEQTLGRTHRSGQEADEVEVDVCLHTPELKASFYAALIDAEFQQLNLNQRQRLLIARSEIKM